ncbi:hypothetical protein LWI28_019156 [Acer negundo]|uniref:Uncharacterized protein n=1 Tax=Acer negundo TaxID=4023 RepID=A0AAD5JFQ7_ACENE|nr:hypothetical protein LWI28_019156 [Acer negundo]
MEVGLVQNLCGKPGHVVSSCYKRFDQAFQGLSMQNMQPSGSQQGNSQGFLAHMSQYNTAYNNDGYNAGHNAVHKAGYNTGSYPNQMQMQGYNTNFSNAGK